MQCTEIRQLISSYIDDRLGLDEKKAFAFHIRNCSNCREELEEVQSVHELFTSAERFSAPYGFTTRVMARLETNEPSRWRAFLTLRPFALRVMEWAFAIIVVITGLLFGNLLTADKGPPAGQATIQESFSLDLFQATPPDSIGGVYVALAEATHEK
jgi:predicted anti-sigma-YlaC factor YlaD